MLGVPLWIFEETYTILEYDVLTHSVSNTYSRSF